MKRLWNVTLANGDKLTVETETKSPSVAVIEKEIESKLKEKGIKSKITSWDWSD